jgi:hypothetical protein
MFAEGERGARSTSSGAFSRAASLGSGGSVSMTAKRPSCEVTPTSRTACFACLAIPGGCRGEVPNYSPRTSPELADSAPQRLVRRPIGRIDPQEARRTPLRASISGRGTDFRAEATRPGHQGLPRSPGSRGHGQPWLVPAAPGLPALARGGRLADGAEGWVIDDASAPLLTTRQRTGLDFRRALYVQTATERMPPSTTSSAISSTSLA